MTATDTLMTKNGHELHIGFLGHGSLRFDCLGRTLYIDPVAMFADYTDAPKADLILVTHHHDDHCDPALIKQLLKPNGEVISTETVVGQLGYGTPMHNGEVRRIDDLLTIEEYKQKARPKVVMTWAPHPRPLPQAVPNSFAEWMNATDYDFVITHPEGYELDPKFVGRARVEYDQMKAFEGADFIYAKNWAAYTGDNYGQILNRDRSWTVSDRQMAVTNNAYFMHCLPVRRNMIVTDDVIEGPRSIVIPEAANREISATVVLKRLIEGLA